jgi:hypothetical protein
MYVIRSPWRSQEKRSQNSGPTGAVSLLSRASLSPTGEQVAALPTDGTILAGPLGWFRRYLMMRLPYFAFATCLCFEPGCSWVGGCGSRTRTLHWTSSHARPGCPERLVHKRHQLTASTDFRASTASGHQRLQGINGFRANGYAADGAERSTEQHVRSDPGRDVQVDLAYIAFDSLSAWNGQPVDRGSASTARTIEGRRADALCSPDGALIGARR